jgi:hypothetical protein
MASLLSEGSRTPYIRMDQIKRTLRQVYNPDTKARHLVRQAPEDLDELKTIDENHKDNHDAIAETKAEAEATRAREPVVVMVLAEGTQSQSRSERPGQGPAPARALVRRS